MARGRTGAIYESHGMWFGKLTIAKKRKGFALPTATTEVDARTRCEVLVQIAMRLEHCGHEDLAVTMCKQAADADDALLRDLLRLLEGVESGRERKAAPASSIDPARTTLRAFGEMWTSGELHRLFPAHLKEVEQHDNRSRLERHVYPFIGSVLMSEFSLDHADLVLRQPSIPKGSLRHVSLVLHRLVVLAVYPGRILKTSPLPKGWLPRQRTGKAKEWLLPREEALLMSKTTVPLVRRLLEGFMVREGMREGEAARLEWTDLDLDHPGGEGSVSLDENKTDDPRSWALDPAVAEALRRWRKVVPASKWVFPAEALPGPQRRRGKHISVSQLAKQLRADLQEAGVNRQSLFEDGPRRMRLRAHDLRGTFVTIALATGKTETWVQDRTGHRSSTMINLYRRQARKAAELNLGPLKPLHEAIPELAAMDDARDQSTPHRPTNGEVTPSNMHETVATPRMLH